MPTSRPSIPKLNIPDRQTTTDLANKSFEELIKQLEDNIPRNLDTGEHSKAERQQNLIDATYRAAILHMETTRRLIIELKNFNNTTTLFSWALIALAIGQIIVAVIKR